MIGIFLKENFALMTSHVLFPAQNLNAMLESFDLKVQHTSFLEILSPNEGRPFEPPKHVVFLQIKTINIVLTRISALWLVYN